MEGGMIERYKEQGVKNKKETKRSKFLFSVFILFVGEKSNKENKYSIIDQLAGTENTGRGKSKFTIVLKGSNK